MTQHWLQILRPSTGLAKQLRMLQIRRISGQFVSCVLIWLSSNAYFALSLHSIHANIGATRYFQGCPDQSGLS
jgi:hypothetical protein